FFSVDGDGGRVSALDLHTRRPHARRAQGGVSAIDGSFWWRRGLFRVRSRPGLFLAKTTPHFSASVLLRRIWHRAARRVASLGKFTARQSEGVERLQKIVGPRRLASVAGIVCGGGLQISIRRGDHQAVDSTGGCGAKEVMSF